LSLQFHAALPDDLRHATLSAVEHQERIASGQDDSQVAADEPYPATVVG
jgi:hypothetical protein